MAHKGPSGEEVAIESQRAAEIVDCFFVLGFEGVVVADDAAGFGAKFVGGSGELGEEGEFGAGPHDEEEVGVVVEGVDAVGVVVDDCGEEGVGVVEVCGRVGLGMSLVEGSV